MMKPISPLKTGRYKLEFRQIGTGDAMRIAAIPHAEASTTQFLKAAITAPDIDPLELTACERVMAVCHYTGELADGGYDFKVGEGRLGNYLLFETEYRSPEPVERDIEGDKWRCIHLLGKHAEAIERLSGEFSDTHIGMYWQAGVMAAQLRNDGDPADEPENLDDWLKTRIKLILTLPESMFWALQQFHEDRAAALNHFLDLRPDMFSGGLSAQAQEGDGLMLPPATFPALSALHWRTRQVHQIFARTGDDSIT